MFERKLAQWASVVRDQFNIPARLVLWGGQGMNVGESSDPSGHDQS
ncbi:class I SAM-dependent methyltransferase [Oligella ureolytica]